jgi:hypothetical protein
MQYEGESEKNAGNGVIYGVAGIIKYSEEMSAKAVSK